jgi:hypothetical protein
VTYMQESLFLVEDTKDGRQDGRDKMEHLGLHGHEVDKLLVFECEL